MFVMIVWSVDENYRRTLEGVYSNEQAAQDKAMDLQEYFEHLGWSGLSVRVESYCVKEEA